MTTGTHLNTDSSLITMQNVVKRYEHFAMENFNLQLDAGEVMGLIGPNGAGKTTCLRLIMGFIPADRGEIYVLGKNVQQEVEKIKELVAYVSEDMRMFGNKTIYWHMQFFATIFSSWDAAYANKLLHTFDLNAEYKIKTLSLGQRIKASLLLALARRPRILVLDEPSTGLDPVARYELTSQLFHIMLNEEHSVIFSSQFTQDVERLSDRIVFIDDGQVISNKDKETYLDQWKRVEIPLEAEKHLELFDDIKETQRNAYNISVIHSDFSSEKRRRYREAGLEVQPQNLTLEEIFIAQTLYRRKQKNNAAHGNPHNEASIASSLYTGGN